MQHILSLGAGVQSSTLALLAAHGEVTPMPNLAIFADTGWEPAAVYRWLDELEQLLPFPVVRVGNGNLRSDQLKARRRGTKTEDGGRWATLPYYVDVPGQHEEGRIRRQCTAEYKIQPIETYLRRTVLGLEPRQHAPKTVQIVQWRGISTDEASRMKPSQYQWMETRYPLAMELGFSRADCVAWMERNGYGRPPRSACLGCPFHTDVEWRHIRDNDPVGWADAVEFDRAIRDAGGMRGKTYLHRQRVPLDQVDLSTAEDRGQRDWINECEGMCGV